jgi:hypothetical protein
MLVEKGLARVAEHSWAKTAAQTVQIYEQAAAPR